MNNRITIALSENEALVLFEFLARFCNDKTLQILDRAENRVLCDLHSQLESTLVQPLMPTYREQLESAREALRPTEP